MERNGRPVMKWILEILFYRREKHRRNLTLPP